MRSTRSLSSGVSGFSCVKSNRSVLGKISVQFGVEVARGGQVAAEGLLDDDAGIVRAAGGCEPVGDHAEQARRDGQVIERALRGTQRGAELLKRGGVVVIAVHVFQQRGELGERVGVHAAAVFLQARPRAVAELVEPEAGLGDADDGHVQVTVLDHRLERREDFLVREIAGCAEDDERIGALGGDRRGGRRGPSNAGGGGTGWVMVVIVVNYIPSTFFSTCPPN